MIAIPETFPKLTAQKYQAGDIIRFDSLDREISIDFIYEDVKFD